MPNQSKIHPLLTAIKDLLPSNSPQIIDFLIAENRTLRSKLGKRIHLTIADKEELVRKGLPVKKYLSQLCTIVKPETILAWNRQMKKGKWNYTKNRQTSKPGRPSKSNDAVSIVCNLATENRDWGYLRISGEMKKLGHKISASTVRNIMKKHGFQPAPKRKGLDWKEFINSHKQDRWATDYFTEEVWSMGGLITCYVLFFINVTTRKVYIAGCTRYPVASWVKQQARNFSMHLSDIGMKCKYLIHDNDTSFIALDSVLKGEGVKVVKTPIHTPVCNCYAERFVKEARGTLDKLILFGDRQLYNTMKVIEKYHNEYRPHQGIDNCIPEEYDYPESETLAKEVKCLYHLGGLLKHYYAGRKAA